MAARRLIILMVILLGISTLLAAALPDRVREAEEDRTASEASTATAKTRKTEVAPPEAAAKAGSGNPCKTGVLKCFELDADEPEITVIPVDAGDQLVLVVSHSKDDLVEIGRLGFVDVVGPGNPATFDIFADQPGEFGITLADAARTIGRIEVTQSARVDSAPASAGDRP